MNRLDSKMTDMIIPKYIHYCWFGSNPLPKKYVLYMETWKKYFPDYKIILWNENNFPVEQFEYAKEALKAKKMAFVSDVARVYALEKMGGVYFDTDVEVLQSFEDILKGKKAVLGTESEQENSIGTGFMAFVPHHPVCQRMLQYYSKHKFLVDENNFDTTPNTHILADILYKEYALRPSEKMQKAEDIVLYPQEYFTAYNGFTGRNEITNHTYCAHHFAGSWSTPIGKIKGWFRRKRNRALSVIYSIYKK